MVLEPELPVPEPQPQPVEQPHRFKRLDQITAAVLMLCASAMLVVFCVYVPPAMKALTGAGKAMQGTANAATATLNKINADCVPGKPCGTLADVNQTLHTIRGTFGQVEVAAKHENAQLTTLDTQERDLFNGAQGVLKQSRETLRAAQGFASSASSATGTLKETIRDAQPALKSLAKTSHDLGKAAQALTARVNDPHVAQLMTHLDGTATNLDGATADVKTVFDRVAHPPPCKGKWCPLIKTVKVASAAHDLPEFGYWTALLIKTATGQ